MEHCSLLPLWRPDRESSTDFGQHRTSASRSEVPRRDDGSGQTASWVVATRPRVPDWSAYPQRTPSGGGFAPTPRENLYFDPKRSRAGIVTCGGLCPGLNNVVRSLFRELHDGYDVPEVFGFRMGYQGLDPSRAVEPFVLNHTMVDEIHKHGGTLLGTSRGAVNIDAAVENLIQRKVDMLFCIGGDGTQRGAYAIYEACRKRGHSLSVVGIPKTIDNDVRHVTRTFGYLTALEESCRVIDAAHTEARSVHNGVALVKLMGRHAGFIAAGATIANQDVNFALIPELPFSLNGPGGFLAALKKRILERAHAVVVVAEGAGQDLFPDEPQRRDASGNIKLHDIVCSW